MCVLHVTSRTMSFKDFLKSTDLPILWSYEKGDLSATPKKLPREIGKKLKDTQYPQLAKIKDTHYYPTDNKGIN